MLKKKVKPIPPSEEELRLKEKIKALQKNKRKLFRAIDDIDTEIIGYKERVLSLQKKRKQQ